MAEMTAVGTESSNVSDINEVLAAYYTYAPPCRLPVDEDGEPQHVDFELPEK